jgi:hypothetical protein
VAIVVNAEALLLASAVGNQDLDVVKVLCETGVDFTGVDVRLKRRIRVREQRLLEIDDWMRQHGVRKRGPVCGLRF